VPVPFDFRIVFKLMEFLRASPRLFPFSFLNRSIVITSVPYCRAQNRAILRNTELRRKEELNLDCRQQESLQPPELLTESLIESLALAKVPTLLPRRLPSLPHVYILKLTRSIPLSIKSFNIPNPVTTTNQSLTHATRVLG